MKVYIVTVPLAFQFIKSNLISGFVEVYYKSSDGPLGFNIDAGSGKLFRQIVNNTFWYTEHKLEVLKVDANYLNQHGLYTFDGLFMMPNDYINEEIEIEKLYKIIEEKNIPLKRFNRPLIEAKVSVFHNIYNIDERRYNSEKISLLLSNVDLAFGCSDSLGSHFIMRPESEFYKRLNEACYKLDVDIINVQSEAEVPAW